MNKTDEKIREAFMSLYMEKPIEKISIRAIAEKAGINRGTFYDHYLDIYDLRDKIETEFEADVMIMVREIAGYFISGDATDIMDYFMPFYKSNWQMIALFLVKRPSARMQRKVKTQAQKAICTYLGLDFDNITTEQKCIMEYISSGQIGLATYWFSKGAPLEIADLAHMIRDINTCGPWTTLQQTIPSTD